MSVIIEETIEVKIHLAVYTKKIKASTVFLCFCLERTNFIMAYKSPCFVEVFTLPTYT